jgi:hypothetical protein
VLVAVFGRADAGRIDDLKKQARLAAESEPRSAGAAREWKALDACELAPFRFVRNQRRLRRLSGICVVEYSRGARLSTVMATGRCGGWIRRPSALGGDQVGHTPGCACLLAWASDFGHGGCHTLGHVARGGGIGAGLGAMIEWSDAAVDLYAGRNTPQPVFGHSWSGARPVGSER